MHLARATTAAILCNVYIFVMINLLSIPYTNFGPKQNMQYYVDHIPMASLEPLHVIEPRLEGGGK